MRGNRGDDDGPSQLLMIRDVFLWVSFFSIGSYKAVSLITTIVESQNYQKFGRATMTENSTPLILPDNQVASHAPHFQQRGFV
jgi:hypothetical protein